MYGARSRRTLAQDTADANYILLGHSCFAVCRRGDCRHMANGRQHNTTCRKLDLCPCTTMQCVNAAVQINVLNYNIAIPCRSPRQCTAMYAVWTGLNAGILHPAIAAVLFTTRGSPNASLARVVCCWCRAVSSGVEGESSSQHGCHESQIAVHRAGTVVRCWFIPDDSISLCGWHVRWSYQ